MNNLAPKLIALYLALLSGSALALEQAAEGEFLVEQTLSSKFQNTAAHVRTGPVTVSLVDGRSGQAIELFPSQPGRAFVPSRANQSYRLVVKNSADFPVLAVTSINGMSTTTGLPSSQLDGGYLVKPGASVEIAGWRVNLQEVTGFVFPGDGGAQPSAEKVEVALFRPRLTADPERNDFFEGVTLGGKDSPPVPADNSAKATSVVKSQTAITPKGPLLNSPAKRAVFSRADTAPSWVAGFDVAPLANLRSRGIAVEHGAIRVPLQ